MPVLKIRLAAAKEGFQAVGQLRGFAYLPIYFEAVRGQTTVGSGLVCGTSRLQCSFAAAVLLAGPATTLVNLEVILHDISIAFLA